MNTNPKILFVHHGSVIGGAPVSLYNLMQGLKAQHPGIAMKVLCANQSMVPFFREIKGVEVGKIYNPCLILGRTLIGYSKLTSVKTWALILKELLILPYSIFCQLRSLKTAKPDIVHLNSSILFTTAVAAKLLRLPLVWHVREVVLGGNYNIRRKMYGWFIRKMSSRVIAISPLEAQHLGKDRHGKVAVIYNSVDFSIFDFKRFIPSEEKAKLGVPGDKKLVLSLGGGSFRKGTAELLESSLHMEDNVKIAVAGTGLEEKTLHAGHAIFFKTCLDFEDVLIRKKIKKYLSWFYEKRLQQAYQRCDKEKIIILGPIKDIAPVVAAADVLVFAGTTPHFPRPIYEAWTMKKAVVVFDMKGVSENVEDGVDGLIVRDKSPRGLANAIRQIIDRMPEARQMGEAGYIKSVERFDLKKNARQIWTIYEQLTK
jgi:glycosyltransferase involved in cell wall biosynthesis